MEVFRPDHREYSSILSGENISSEVSIRDTGVHMTDATFAAG